MKKVSVFILAFLYLFVSSGIAINTHYCMGQLASVDLFDHSSEKCSNCGMPSNNEGCCKDEFKMVKLQDSHKLADNIAPIYATSALLPVQPNYLVKILNNPIVIEESIAESPPGLHHPSLCILNCVFRC